MQPSEEQKVNKDIMEHNRKRAVESKLFELQEAMLEQGYNDEEIESKLSFKRKQLERESQVINNSHLPRV